MASNDPDGLVRNKFSGNLQQVTQGRPTSLTRGVSLDTGITMFRRNMSSIELLEWLRIRGLSEMDLSKLEDEGFTGESFLLLHKEAMKEIGIKFAGQMLIKKLLRGEASIDRGDEELHSPTIPVSPLETVNQAGDFRVTEASSHLHGGGVVQNSQDSTEPCQVRAVETRNNFGGAALGSSTNTCPSVPSTLITNRFTADTPSASGNSQQQIDESDVERVDPTLPATPECNRFHESDDVEREEEVRVFPSFRTPVYCTTGPYEGASVFSFDHNVQMYRDKVWAGRQVLRVFFLNPDVLRGWGLTTDTILEWAGVWQSRGDDRIPIFQLTSVVRKADIRVKFSETEGCWSAVGMDAEKIVTQDEPTMMLNLKGLVWEFQKSLVIHEFGHALGLDHEHQRSDFWDSMKMHINLTKVPEGQRIRLEKRDDTMEREEACRYDPESIMHYWFDISWLKNPAYQDIHEVKHSRRLSPAEKRCLSGMHERQRPTLLPKEPSESDFQQLVYIYGGEDQCLVTPTTNFEFQFSSASHMHTRQRSGSVPVSAMHSGFSDNGRVDDVGVLSSLPVGLGLSSSRSEDVPSSSYTNQRRVSHPSYLVGASHSENERVVLLQVNTHLQGIKNAIWGAQAKWRAIGKGLKIPSHELDTFETFGSTGRSLEAVLLRWIHRGTASIDQLLDVLKCADVNEADIADNILKTRDLRERQRLGL